MPKPGDFSRFESPDKLQAYAGLSLSTYQSGQLLEKPKYRKWLPRTFLRSGFPQRSRASIFPPFVKIAHFQRQPDHTPRFPVTTMIFRLVKTLA